MVMQLTEPLQWIAGANARVLASQAMAGPSFCCHWLFWRGFSAPILRCFCDRILLGHCSSSASSKTEMARLSLTGLLAEAKQAQVVEEKGLRAFMTRDSLEEEYRKVERIVHPGGSWLGEWLRMCACIEARLGQPTLHRGQQ